ncbi:helix-turn-helix transcriptional regulator [Streptomyces albus]|uniref:helix-turn-helix domain-containing protein n=1 Tax=Streptomyces albus TaxID=1888 RepID=UPI0033D82C91
MLQQAQNAPRSSRFGPELRRLRMARGFTLGGLSALVHYSKSQLSKVERGLKAPSSDLARLCDNALKAEGALISLVPPARSASAPAPAPAPEHCAATEAEESEFWLMQFDPTGSAWLRPVARRSVMAAGAAGAMALGMPAAPAQGHTPGFLSQARSLFDTYRAMGQTSAPGLVLPALVAQTHALRTLAERTEPPLRRDAFVLASRYAEFVGWLMQETGDDRAALWWTDLAVRTARRGGDEGLAAYALVRRALVAFYAEDGSTTVGLSRRAQAAEPQERIAGLAAQQEAQGYALLGDHSACMKALDRARALLSQPDRSGAPVIGTTNLSDPVSMITGWCLHDLGRPQRAAEILDEQVSRLPAHALRTQARYGVRRALAHAQAGEIEHACTLTERLLDTVDTVGSATVRTDLRRLARVLARHPSVKSVRELDHRLTASLHM